jgi:hypothetical protein
MSKGENIVKWIKGQRISWLGHQERMEEDRTPEKILTQEPEGTRRRGRPRKKCSAGQSPQCQWEEEEEEKKEKKEKKEEKEKEEEKKKEKEEEVFQTTSR